MDKNILTLVSMHGRDKNYGVDKQEFVLVQLGVAVVVERTRSGRLLPAGLSNQATAAALLPTGDHLLRGGHNERRFDGSTPVPREIVVGRELVRRAWRKVGLGSGPGGHFFGEPEGIHSGSANQNLPHLD